MLTIPETGGRTLALDLGGTAVKASIFNEGALEKSTTWRHRYRDIPANLAQEHLIRESREFAGVSVERVGLSLAGLLADDGTLFRSTVLTAFEGTSFREIFQEAFGAQHVSLDNDADCGAIGENFFAGSELFYVVAGSGIGSAYVDAAGDVRYLVRINRTLPYSDEMNHPISDIGLRLLIPKDEIFEYMKQYGVSAGMIDSILVPRNRTDGKGLTAEGDEITFGRLGSASGVRTLLEILWNGKFEDNDFDQHYRTFIRNHHLASKVSMEELKSEFQAAAPIAELALHGDEQAERAYRLMGTFLGLAIARAQRILLADLLRTPPVHLGGRIMASGHLFISEIREAVASEGIECDCRISTAFQNGENPNLWGAFISAQRV